MAIRPSRPLFLFVACVAPCAFAETLVETLASQPAEHPQAVALAQARMPSQRAGVGFGRTTRLTAGKMPVADAMEAACGPSPFSNVLSCVSLASGVELAQLPVPGEVSAVPVFFDDSWLVGTADGVLVRSAGISPNGAPAFRSHSAVFWGPDSRKVIARLRESQKTKDKEAEATALRESMGWRWALTNSSEYVGKPIIHKDLVYALTANQFLQAIDWQTGALRWASRLSPDVPLRMASSSLAATDREIIVGGDDGFLTAFDPARGTQLWRVALSGLHGLADKANPSPDRFPAIVVPVLTGARSIVVANAESRLHRISLETRQAEWSFPFGAVAELRLDQDMLYVGTSAGEVVAVRERTGELRWKTKFSPESPIASIYPLDERHLILATTSGRIGLLDRRSGTLLDSKSVGMDFVGEWFLRGQGSTEACISVATGGLRCFGVRR